MPVTGGQYYLIASKSGTNFADLAKVELFYVLIQVYSSRNNLHNNVVGSQKIYYEILRDEFVHMIQASATITTATSYQV